MTAVRIDVGNLMAPRLAGGVEPQRLRGELSDTFRAAFAEMERRREAGELGFLDLPYRTELVREVTAVADGFGQWFEDVAVLGIGGSGLGAESLRDALLGPYWNAMSDEERDHYPRLHILDNPDPHTFRGLMARLDPARTLFNVVSKSGATAETMALYLAVRDRLDESVGPDKARGHLLFTTDPRRGALRRIGEEEGIPMLPVPENVGGRFSVLSPVGLLPAAVTGVDVDALLAGAAAMEQRCREPELLENPAGLLATLLYDAEVRGGRPIHVLMPYADRLRTLTFWFQQLWAESLGKKRRADGSAHIHGPTPVAALGAVDQHSLLQLFVEGPPDKVILFMEVEDHGQEVPIPVRHPDVPEVAYLGGHTLEGLLHTERRATAEALRREGRPNATVLVPTIDAHAMGQLYMFFQMATVLAGALYDVDPLDQPGVELGKQLTYGLMGREGVEVPEIPDPDPEWVV